MASDLVRDLLQNFVFAFGQTYPAARQGGLPAAIGAGLMAPFQLESLQRQKRQEELNAQYTEAQIRNQELQQFSSGYNLLSQQLGLPTYQQSSTIDVNTGQPQMGPSQLSGYVSPTPSMAVPKPLQGLLGADRLPVQSPQERALQQGGIEQMLATMAIPTDAARASAVRTAEEEASAAFDPLRLGPTERFEGYDETGRPIIRSGPGSFEEAAMMTLMNPDLDDQDVDTTYRDLMNHLREFRGEPSDIAGLDRNQRLLDMALTQAQISKIERDESLGAEQKRLILAMREDWRTQIGWQDRLNEALGAQAVIIAAENADDIALMNNFVRFWDPRGTVREGDISLVQAGVPLAGQLERWWRRYVMGETILLPSALRQQMLDEVMRGVGDPTTGKMIAYDRGLEQWKSQNPGINPDYVTIDPWTELRSHPRVQAALSGRAQPPISNNPDPEELPPEEPNLDAVPSIEDQLNEPGRFQ